MVAVVGGERTPGGSGGTVKTGRVLFPSARSAPGRGGAGRLWGAVSCFGDFSIYKIEKHPRRGRDVFSYFDRESAILGGGRWVVMQETLGRYLVSVISLSRK